MSSREEALEKALETIRSLHTNQPLPQLPDDLPTRQPLAAQVLTDREIEVVQRISDGMTNVEISLDMRIGAETVKSHVRHALAKTGARNRAHLVAILLSERTLRPPPFETRVFR